MRSGYLPANYACIYFSQTNSEKLKYLVSDDALDLFSKNLIAWQDLIDLSIAHVRFILCPYGIELLHTSHITVDKVKLLPYEVVDASNETNTCYRKVYQALAFNLISFEYLRQKYQALDSNIKNYWRLVSEDIDTKTINEYFTGLRAKDNDNDKKYERLSSPEVLTLITQGIITWLDFVPSFLAPAMGDIEKTRFALTEGMLRLLRNKIVHIDELKPISYTFIKEFNQQPASFADKFYEALDRKYIKFADVKAFCLSYWNSTQLMVEFGNFLDQSCIKAQSDSRSCRYLKYYF